MGVTDVQDANPADPIQEAVSVQVFYHCAFPSGDGNRVDTADGGGDSVGAAVNKGLRFGAGDRGGDDFRQCSAKHGDHILSIVH